jgi:hypothetical protein
MSQTQNKTNTNIKSNLKSLLSDAERGIANAGIATMIVAAIVGMTELADRQDQKILALQPAFTFAHDTGGQLGALNGPDMSVRKEREEIGHQPTSYGVSMRSHATSGHR